ncbi:hypothetical protein D3C75_996970 [compost metagenome]
MLVERVWKIFASQRDTAFTDSASGRSSVVLREARCRLASCCCRALSDSELASRCATTISSGTLLAFMSRYSRICRLAASIQWISSSSSTSGQPALARVFTSASTMWLKRARASMAKVSLAKRGLLSSSRRSSGTRLTANAS